MVKQLSIVINNHHMRLVVLSKGKRGITVSALLQRKVPKGMIEDGIILDVKAFSNYLTAILKNAEIEVKHVLFALSSDRIVTREIVLPELNEEKLLLTIKANAGEYFPIDLSGCVLAYFPIAKLPKEQAAKEKKQSNKLRLMVLAAPEVMVQSYYAVAELANLKLDSVDYTGNSLSRLMSGSIGDMPCLVIWLNRDSGVLTIYDQGIMILQRSVDAVNSTIYQGEEDRLSAIISDIKRVVEYYAGRNDDSPLEQIYLFGEESVAANLKVMLRSRLNLPVEMITGLDCVRAEEHTGISAGDILGYADNIGAAIAPVDFMPKRVEENRKRKQEDKAYRLMILLAIFISAVIITIPATRYFAVGTEVLDLKNHLLITEDVKPILTEYREAEQRYKDVQEVRKQVRTDNESLTKFITVFEQLKPSNLSITSFSCNEGEISFTALADGKKTAAKLIQQLNHMANVSEVKVSGLSSSFIDDSETVTFSVTCRLTNEDTLLQRAAETSASEEKLTEEAP